ncbi:MAG: hypothetical protein U0525_05350 [Patescibacteria group bacterium]
MSSTFTSWSTGLNGGPENARHRGTLDGLKHPSPHNRNSENKPRYGRRLLEIFGNLFNNQSRLPPTTSQRLPGSMNRRNI